MTSPNPVTPTTDGLEALLNDVMVARIETERYRRFDGTWTSAITFIHCTCRAVIQESRWVDHKDDHARLSTEWEEET